MKRLFQTLATALVMFTVSTSAFAGVTFTVGDVQYETLTGTTAEVDKFVGGTDIVIPSTVENAGTTYNVVKLAWSIQNSGAAIVGAVNSIEVPASVTTIEAGAFNKLTALKSIVLLNSVPTTGAIAFNNMVDFGVEVVVTVPVGSLADYQSAASWAKFKGSFVEASGEPAEPTTEIVDKGITYTLDTESGEVTITKAEGVSGEITIPATMTFDGVSKPVTTIAPSAFAGCALTKINLKSETPQAFTYVVDGKENSFDGGKECIVVVPEGTLAAYSMDSYWGAQFTVEELVVVYEKTDNGDKYDFNSGDFKYCLQWSALKVSGYTGSEEEIVLLSEDVVMAGGSGFIAESHQGWIGETVKVTKVGYGALKSATTVKKVTVSEGITTLENMAFSSTTIESIVLPTTLTGYAMSPFSGASALSSLEVLNETPAKVTTGKTFVGVPATCELTVPKGTLDAYKAAWSEFPGTMVEKDATTTGVEAEAAASVAVYANAGAIVVAGAEAGAAIEVYSVTGAKVAATVAEGETAISLASGIYVVRVAGVTYKVVCK